MERLFRKAVERLIAQTPPLRSEDIRSDAQALVATIGIDPQQAGAIVEELLKKNGR